MPDCHHNPLRTRAVLGVVAAFFGSACSAGPTATRPNAPIALTVIHDSGYSIPLAPYLSYLVPGLAQPGALPDFEFPILALLRPGVLTREDVPVFDAQWLVQPIFILGTDRVSVQWLTHNRDRLTAMHAWGVVISAPDLASFKNLQQFAQGMEIAPSQGPWLDQHLARAGINAYPVLIGTNGRARQIVLTDVLQNAPVEARP